MVRALCPTKYP